MTAQEHKLIVYMFAKQTELLMSVIQMLESRDIIAEGDFVAYQNLVRAKELEVHNVLRQTIAQYHNFATSLGVLDLPPDTY
jgi:hypothetical protein